MRWVTARPVLTVAALGGVATLAHLWWIAANRRAGSLSVDESAYISNALELHRAMASGPDALVERVFETSTTGPLVPLWSVPAFVVGGRSVTAALLSQALVVVLAAVAATGVVRRLAGGRAALVGGVVVLGYPAMLASARTYQFAAALGACLLLALWALLASDRGARRGAMVGLGAAVGCVALTRTMGLALLPGLALAAAVVIRWRRRELLNVGLAVAVAALVAAPWYWANREPVFDYLFGYGYGEEATSFGDPGLLSRLTDRATAFVSDAGVIIAVLAGLAIVAVLADSVVRIRRGATVRELPVATRGMAAVALVVVTGMAALASTANRGVWFELPVELVALSGLVAAGALVDTRPLRAVGVLAVVAAVVNMGVSLTDIGAAAPGAPRSPVQRLFYDELTQANGDTLDADPRLGSGDPGLRRAAAQEWWSAIDEVTTVLDDRFDRYTDMRTSVAGSAQLFNASTVNLARELRILEDGPIENADTDPRGVEHFLDPWTDGRRRVLVVIDTDRGLFPVENRAAELDALARRNGWVEVHSSPLPYGGSVTVLDHQPSMGLPVS